MDHRGTRGRGGAERNRGHELFRREAPEVGGSGGGGAEDHKNCVKVKEHLADGTTEYKYYAPGLGVVRKVPPDGDVLLKSHKTRPAK